MALTKVSRGLLSTGIVDNSTTTAITIDSSENVGIGTSSPDSYYSKRLVVSAPDENGITIVGTTSSYNYLMFADGTSGDATYRGYMGYDHADDSMVFATAAQNRLRIDSSGNVGVSVIPPAWGSAYANVNVGTAGSFWGTKTGASLVAMSDNSYFNGSAYLARNTGAGSKYYQNAGAHYWDNAASVSAGAAQTNVERMRLDASGSLLVGTTTSRGRITANTVDGVAAIGTTVASAINYNAVSFHNNAGTQVGRILANNAGTTQYITSSDARLKDNIANATDSGELIDTIQVRQFDWKSDGSHQDYGMIAQELQVVAPDAVAGDPDSEEVMGVDYSKLVPMLVKEIQSLRTRVQELENN